MVNLGSGMVIDSHIHLPSPGWEGNTSFFPSVAKAVDYLKATGTTAAIFNTWQGVLAKTEQDIHEANAAALRLMDEYRGFLYPGAVIYPDFPEASCEWLARFRDRGLKWVGELVLSNHSHRYIDPAFLRLFEECAKFGHIVQLHCHGDVLDLARRFPDTRFVMAHVTDDSTLTQMAAIPNLWQDISGMAAGLHVGRLERAVEILGVKRLLYGTDFDGYEPRAFLARVSMVVPDPHDRAQILSANLIRLLEEAGSRPIL